MTNDIGMSPEPEAKTPEQMLTDKIHLFAQTWEEHNRNLSGLQASKSQIKALAAPLLKHTTSVEDLDLSQLDPDATNLLARLSIASLIQSEAASKTRHRLDMLELVWPLSVDRLSLRTLEATSKPEAPDAIAALTFSESFLNHVSYARGQILRALPVENNSLSLRLIADRKSKRQNSLHRAHYYDVTFARSPATEALVDFKLFK